MQFRCDCSAQVFNGGCRCVCPHSRFPVAALDAKPSRLSLVLLSRVRVMEKEAGWPGSCGEYLLRAGEADALIWPLLAVNLVTECLWQPSPPARYGAVSAAFYILPFRYDMSLFTL